MELDNYGANYFMAANGYGGFRNYFKEIFAPNEYTRLYVLKGGPGTGKSSLMKKIYKEFCNLGYDCERIYCSSDPNSLDGVTIMKDGKKFAILDGTAPHETDAKIPGAIDEIINLGTAWDKKRLTDERKTIEKINKRKSGHYNEAYEYLRVGGVISREIERGILDAYTGFDLQFINDVLFDLKENSPDYKHETRLLSSFSKNGYQQLNAKEKYSKGISVTGSFGSEYLFLNHLSDEVVKRKISHIRFPSPFSDNLTEGIYLTESDTLVTVLGIYEDVLDTSAFLEPAKLSQSKEKFTYYAKLREELLSRAQNEFSLASRAHFELEEIYSAAMNFELIDKMTNHIISEIKEYSA